MAQRQSREPQGVPDILQLLNLQGDRRAVAFQMLRFGVVGFVVTISVAASYWLVTEALGVDPMISFTVVFIFFSLVSYLLHGAISFRDHGSRDRHHVRLSRFVVVNLVGFGANQFFVWLLVKKLDGPTWWPVVPIIMITPILTFSLQRRWVFA